jgi:uncharacterized protein YfaS (alpha-2-macroglobulin family)
MLFNSQNRGLLLLILLLSYTQIVYAQNSLNDDLLQRKITELISSIPSKATELEVIETEEQRITRNNLEFEKLKEITVQNLEKSIYQTERKDCHFETVESRNTNNVDLFCIKLGFSDFFLDDYISRVKVSYQKPEDEEAKAKATSQVTRFNVFYNEAERKICVEHDLPNQSVIKIALPEGIYKNKGAVPCKKRIIEDTVYRHVNHTESEESKIASYDLDIKERENAGSIDLCLRIDKNTRNYSYWYDNDDASDFLFFKKDHLNDYLSKLVVKSASTQQLESLKHVNDDKEKLFKSVSIQNLKPYLAYSGEKQALYERFLKNKEKVTRENPEIEDHPDFFSYYEYLCLKKVDLNHTYRISFNKTTTTSFIDNELKAVNGYVNEKSIVVHDPIPKFSTLSNKFILPPNIREIPVYYKNIKKLNAKIYAVDQKNLTFLMSYYDQSVIKSMENVKKDAMPAFALDRDYHQDSYDYFSDSKKLPYDHMLTLLSQQYGHVVWEGSYELPGINQANQNPNDLKASLPLHIDTQKYPNHFFFLLLENDAVLEKRRLEKIYKALPDYLERVKQQITQPVDAEIPGPIEIYIDTEDESKKVSEPEMPLVQTEDEHRAVIYRQIEDELSYIQRLLCILPASFGVHSVETNQGHHIKVLSLDQEQPIAHVKISLVAKNNRIIDSKKTDALGGVFFPKALFKGQDANEVKLIYAENEAGELLILDLEDHHLKMMADSSLGWEQRHGMIWLNRGIYRLGEEVHTLINIRDADGKGKSLPVILRLTKGYGFYSEDATQSLIHSELITTNELGVAEVILNIPENETSGSWAVSIYDYRQLKSMYPLLNQAKTADINKWLNTDHGRNINLEDALLDRQDFKVDYIKPAEFKLKTKVLNPPDLSKPKAQTPPYQIEVEGKYHFGGNLSKVKVETDVFFAKLKQPTQFKKSGYFFGVEKEAAFENLNILDPIVLNDDGLGVINVPSLLKSDSYSPRILKAKLRVFENGRVFEKVVQLPVNLRHCEIGVKLFSERKALEQEDQVFFSIVTTNYLGEPLPKQKLSVIWERQYRFTEDRSGRQAYHTSFQPFLTQEIETNENGEFMLYSRPLEYDVYRLKIQHPTDGTLTMLPFVFNKDMSNDEVDIEEEEENLSRYTYEKEAKEQILEYKLYELNGRVDTSALKTTKNVTTHIEYPADGYAIYQLVDQNDIIWKHEQAVKKGLISTNVPIPDHVPIGANLMIQFIRNTSAEMLDVPKRMLFSAWIPVNREQFETQMKIPVQENRLPSSTAVDIPYEITKDPNEKIFVSFWFVDHAILEFTNYKLKNILKYVFSPRTIPLKIYDMYMHVLEYFLHYPKAQVKFGGDLFIDMDSMKDNDKILSLRSGLLEVPASGKGTVHFDIPKFEGKARLIAYAFGEKRFASLEEVFVVRNEFVIDVFSPDFISLNDESVLRISGHYFGDKEADVKISMTANQEVLAIENQVWQIHMKPKDPFKREIPIKLNRYGEGIITIKIEIPNEKTIEEKFTIQSRPSWNKQNFKQLLELKPQESVTLSLFPHQDFLSYTTQFDLMINHVPLINIKGILNDLNEYPYGCSEQLTSKTFPQLYFEKLFKFYKMPYDAQKVQKQIDKGLKEITALTHPTDGISLWPNSNVGVDLEIATYILHFLSDALRLNGQNQFKESRDALIKRLMKAENFFVFRKDHKEKTGYEAFQIVHAQFTALYSLYVLSAYQLIAKEDALVKLNAFRPHVLNQVDIDQIIFSYSKSYSYYIGYYPVMTLMYHFLNRLVYHAILSQFNIEVPQVPMPITQYLTSLQTNQLLNDQIKILGQMTFFATQSKLYDDQKHDFLKILSKQLDQRTYLSTLDQSWTVLANAKVLETRLEKWKVEYQGKVVEGNSLFQETLQGASALIPKTFKNLSNASVWLQASAFGFSKIAPPTTDEGLSVSRKIYNDQGMLINPVDGKYQFEEGEVVVVDLEVVMKKNHPLIKEGILLKELLPGGWMLLTENQYHEYINQIKASGQNPQFDSELSCSEITKIKKVDRIVYVFDFSKNFKLSDYPSESYLKCHFSYVVSNQFKGNFGIPGAYVEVMNDPSVRGISALEKLEIKP